jgi:hypothetical protein
MRLLNVRLWLLTDQELDDLATARDVDDRAFAAHVRHIKEWRREHLDSEPLDERGAIYQVLR